MTDERLAVIAARMANIREIQACGPADFADMEPWQLQAIVQGYAEDVSDLLAEVERQRDINQQLGQENEQQQAQIPAMRPIVEMFVRGYTDEATFGFPEYILPLDSVNDMARVDALIKQARAYVAAHPAATAVEQ